jgi:hypothetical protein
MASNSVPENQCYGLTVSQWEELREKTRVMHAVCDAFTTRAANDMNEESVATLAMLGFNAGFEVGKLLSEISSKQLGESA